MVICELAAQRKVLTFLPQYQGAQLLYLLYPVSLLLFTSLLPHDMKCLNTVVKCLAGLTILLVVLCASREWGEAVLAPQQQ